MNIMETKICKKCKQAKLYTEYHKQTSSKDGHKNICKECNKIEKQKYMFKKITVTKKKCTNCGIERGAHDYYSNKSNKDGLQSQCKECLKKNRNLSKRKTYKRKTSGTHTCLKCGIKKHISKFSTDKHKTNGLQSWCKKCKKIYNNKMVDLHKTKKSKECKICHEIKKLNEYHINTSGLYGRHNECKICRSNKRRTLRYERITSGTKICTGCNEEYDVSKFHSNVASSDGLQSICKYCRRNRNNKWANEYEHFITRLYNNIKHNAKKRAKKLKVEITKENIHDLYKKQKGLCAISGIKMTHMAYTRTKETRHIMNDHNISVDRIDSNKGYTIDNIQLLCACVNRMKSDMTDYHFKTMCQIITAYGMIKYLEKL